MAQRSLQGGSSQPRTREITLSDLETLPPIRRVSGPSVPLSTLEEQILDYHRADKEKESAFLHSALYDRIAIGLCLLKAQQIHLCATVARRSKKSGRLQSADGFDKWLSEFISRHPDFGRRSAYNYINGAINSGLTSDHGIEHVEAMRAAHALEGKTLKELYRLKDKTPPATKPEPPGPTLVQQAQVALFESLDATITLRDDMAAEVFEACHLRLKETLEKFTGQRWAPVDEVGNADGEHGELAPVATKKKPYRTAGKLTPEARARIMAAQKARWAKHKGGAGK